MLGHLVVGRYGANETRSAAPQAHAGWMRRVLALFRRR